MVATRIIELIVMSTRRSLSLPEDSLGLRPNHPVPGAEKLSSADAARRLHTTGQTIRSLIERDDLHGYWQRVGKVYRFWAYRHAVEQFLASFGQFPDAQKKLTALRRPSQRPRGDHRGQSSDPDTSKLQLRVLGLQETVRCQSAVIAKLQQAMHAQDAVADFLRQAETASSRVTKLVREANDEYSRLVALEGMPDDPSSLG